MNRFASFHTGLVLTALCMAAGCSLEGDLPVDGEMRVGLMGEGPSGQIYRLRDAVFTVDGTNLSTESVPDGDATIATILDAGDYDVLLQNGWRVERLVAGGAFSDVEATLASANPAAVSIVALETTDVTFTFDISGEGSVPFDRGTLEIGVAFNDDDAVCPDANADGFCDVCGDGLVHPGEECDGANLDGNTCADFGFFAGSLSCSADCLLVASGCTHCGDGSLDAGETCDPPGDVVSIQPCGGIGSGCFRLTECNESCQQEVGICEC